MHESKSLNERIFLLCHFGANTTVDEFHWHWLVNVRVFQHFRMKVYQMNFTGSVQ